MAVQVTLPSHAATSHAAAAARRPAAIGAAARGLLARCGAWLHRRNGTAALREMEPHLARDIGVAPGRDCGPEGFALDPRPLWGIGLTPQPMDTRSPRAERCRG